MNTVPKPPALASKSIWGQPSWYGPCPPMQVWGFPSKVSGSGGPPFPPGDSGGWMKLWRSTLRRCDPWRMSWRWCSRRHWDPSCSWNSGVSGWNEGLPQRWSAPRRGSAGGEGCCTSPFERWPRRRWCWGCVTSRGPCRRMRGPSFQRCSRWTNAISSMILIQMTIWSRWSWPHHVFWWREIALRISVFRQSMLRNVQSLKWQRRKHGRRWSCLIFADWNATLILWETSSFCCMHMGKAGTCHMIWGSNSTVPATISERVTSTICRPMPVLDIIGEMRMLVALALSVLRDWSVFLDDPWPKMTKLGRSPLDMMWPNSGWGLCGKGQWAAAVHVESVEQN